MKPLFLFLLLAAVGNAVYHVGQKALPPSANPMTLLMAVYGLAFLFSALAAPWFQRGAQPLPLAHLLSWPILVLGAGIVLIELGFLLAYRTGASLQWSGVAVNGVAALILLPVAVRVFREAFSPARAAGILLTLGGLALMTRK